MLVRNWCLIEHRRRRVTAVWPRTGTCSTFRAMRRATTTSPTCSSWPSTRSPTASRSSTTAAQVTYRELDERATRFAHALPTPGVKAGDHVGDARHQLHRVGRGDVRDLQDPGRVVNVNFRYVEEEMRTSSTTPTSSRSCTSASTARSSRPHVTAPAQARSTSSASSGTAPTPTTPRSTRSSSRPRCAGLAGA